MTEVDWRKCSDPARMLNWLRRKVSARKFRLFSVASCRRIWHLLPLAAAQRAIEVAERYAEGMTEEGERSAAWVAAYTLAEKEKLEGWSDWWEAPDGAAGLAAAAAVGAIGFVGAEEIAANTLPGDETKSTFRSRGEGCQSVNR